MTGYKKPDLSNEHPFAKSENTRGYRSIFKRHWRLKADDAKNQHRFHLLCRDIDNDFRDTDR